MIDEENDARKKEGGVFGFFVSSDFQLFFPPLSPIDSYQFWTNLMPTYATSHGTMGYATTQGKPERKTDGKEKGGVRV